MIKLSFKELKNVSVPRWALIILMFITVLSFFVQSALAPEVSTAESDAVSEMIEPIIPSDTEVGEAVHQNIRKIGHFVEFGFFGAELAIYLFFFSKRRFLDYFVASSLALFIGLLDETVQIFSGRGPQISDVWLDFSGFLSVFVISTLIVNAVFKIINLKRNT